ncbi:MAG: hypothetical protein EP344_10010 [Bacteroidetes bacterium]|nr:MAG: hypothetical protein EP344_10010 [Bacteroidota bacterium]
MKTPMRKDLRFTFPHHNAVSDTGLFPLLLGVYMLVFAACGPASEQPDDGTTTVSPVDTIVQDFFVTHLGDTLPIGVPIPIKGKVISPDSLSQPKTVPMRGQPKVVPAMTNRYPTGVPKIVHLSGNRPVITPGKDGVPLPHKIAVQGKDMPFEQLRITQSVTPKFKDAAADNIQYLSVEEGLGDGRITALLEDSRGNIWWGYKTGGVVERYDGVSLITYKYPEIIPNSIMNAMLEDSRGNIWFGTGGSGLGRYDGRRFTRFTTREGFPGDYIFGLLEDTSGNIWIGTNKGLVRYTPDKADGEGRFILFTEKEGLKGNGTGKFIESRRGNIWIPTWGGPDNSIGYGVVIYTPNTDGTVGSFTAITKQDGLSDDRISETFEDSKGNIWLGTWGGGVIRFTPDPAGGGGTLACFTTQDGLSDDRISSITEDKNGNIWIGTNNGLNQFIPSQTGPGGYFIRYTEKEGMLNSEVYDLLTDDRGNIWIGTFTVINRVVVNGFAQFTQANGLLENSVREILEDKQGDLWLATQGGLCQFLPGNGNENGHFTHITSTEGLSGNYVTQLLEDKNGAILCTIRYPANAVNVFAPPRKGKPGHFTYYTQNEGLLPGLIFGLFKDRQDNIWSFGLTGPKVAEFCRITPSKEGIHKVVHFTTREGWAGYNASSIVEDRNGILWFATWGGGLCRFEPDRDGVSGTATFYPEKGGLETDRLHCLIEDSQGRIWFGTSSGLRRFKPGEDAIPAGYSKCTTKEGLISDEVFSIAEDRQKNIWVATRRGISLLVPDTTDSTSAHVAKWQEYRIFNFNKADGLKQIDFWSNSVCADSKNRMWWGGNKGLTMLDLDRFVLPSGAPKVQLSHIDINEQFVDYRKLSDTAYANTLPFGKALQKSFDSVAAFQNYPVNLELPHDLDMLTFHCSATDWAAAHKIRFSYKMTGLDKDWSKPQQESYTTYRNLPHGTYTFQVKAYGAGQVWSEPLEYTFTILPPWWHTWWARALYVLFGAALLYLIVRWRTAALRRQRTELEQKVAERTAEVQEQQKRSDALLLNILPAEVADELKQTGHTQPVRFEEASILFADFKEFTNIVASIPGKKLVVELDEMFQHFDDIMEAEGLEKIQTIGDAYVAAGGLPTPVPDHAARCVRASRKIIEYLEKRNANSSIKWEIRIGIHSGAVTTGVVGKRKYTYDIFGDTVNIAARVESASESGRICVSAYTHDLIKDEFPCTYRGKINAKGKGDLDMYFVE